MKLALSLILSFVFLLWFVASVVGMVYVSRSAELSWLVPVILGQKRAAEKYSTPIEGICIERKTRLGSGGAVLHCPVYEITLNGETLRMEKEVYSNTGVPQIGESRTLYIDKNDLGSYIEPIADKSARMIGYFISIPFMIAGIITLVLSLI